MLDRGEAKKEERRLMTYEHAMFFWDIWREHS